jgi:hypothetical protein
MPNQSPAQLVSKLVMQFDSRHSIQISTPAQNRFEHRETGAELQAMHRQSHFSAALGLVNIASLRWLTTSTYATGGHRHGHCSLDKVGVGVDTQARFLRRTTSDESAVGHPRAQQASICPEISEISGRNFFKGLRAGTLIVTR